MDRGQGSFYTKAKRNFLSMEGIKGKNESGGQHMSWYLGKEKKAKDRSTKEFVKEVGRATSKK